MTTTVSLQNADLRVARSEVGAAKIALGVGITLLIVKFSAYFVTGSTAIFSDALESIVNVLASGFALYSVTLAHAPADQKHPYGHGKVEFIAAGFEAGMIFAAAVVIAIEAFRSILAGPTISHSHIGLILMLVAMLANGATGLILLRRGRLYGSVTLVADAQHLLADAVTSAAVVISLVVMQFVRWAYIDPLVALGIAGYLAWLSFRLGRQSFAGLMDEQDRTDDLRLRAILDAHVGDASANVAPTNPPICSYHKLRHRHSGRYHWVDFHIMIPASMSIAQGHEMASAIEYEIEQALGEGNATAHVEPCVDADCPTCDRRS